MLKGRGDPHTQWVHIIAASDVGEGGRDSHCIYCPFLWVISSGDEKHQGRDRAPADEAVCISDSQTLPPMDSTGELLTIPIFRLHLRPTKSFCLGLLLKLSRCFLRAAEAGNLDRVP